MLVTNSRLLKSSGRVLKETSFGGTLLQERPNNAGNLLFVSDPYAEKMQRLHESQ